MARLATLLGGWLGRREAEPGTALPRLVAAERPERIYAIGDRPVGFLEAYVQNRSMDYPFGILQLDLKTKENGKEEGEGALIYSAKIKVLDYFDSNLSRCSFCGLCAEVCPTKPIKALVMSEDYELGSYSRDTQILRVDEMYDGVSIEQYTH